MSARRILILILSLLLLVGLCGCGQQAVSPVPVEKTVPEPDADDPAADPETLLLDEMDAIRESAPATDPDLFTFEESGGELTLTAFGGYAATVRVPSEVDGKPVRGLAGTAFSGSSGLQVLILPDTLTEIAERALEGCTSLRYLELSVLPGDSLSGLFGKAGWEYNHSAVPDSLEYIRFSGTAVPDRAFAECLHIRAVILSGSVRTVGTSAFRTCRSLCKIRLSDGLAELGTCAFLDCGSLTELVLPDSLTLTGEGILTGCGSLSRLTLPCLGKTSSDTESAYLARLFGGTSPEFSGAVPQSLHAVTLTSVTEIAPMAFLNCTGLRTVSLPDGLNEIGDMAFFGCSHLKTVRLSDGLGRIGKSAFSGCVRLTGIVLPETLKTIDIQAFQDCLSLQEISLPSGLETVGNSAFASCISLSRVTLAGSPVLGDRVFDETPYAQNRNET